MLRLASGGGTGIPQLRDEDVDGRDALEGRDR